MTAPSLLVFSRDPGPTNMLVAALEILRGAPADGEPPGLKALRAATRATIGNLRIISRPPGDAIWAGGGFAAARWDDRDEDAALGVLKKNTAGLLITGTSDLDEPGDRLLWRAARRMGVESHALLDHPAGLVERFQEADGTMIWPDWLYVPDDVFLDRLVAAKAPRERIRIIGDIHHARLRKLAENRERKDLSGIRAAWGADDKTFALLFASECTWEMSLLGYKTTYSEVEVLDTMLSGLARGELPDGESIDIAQLIVVIRPHPRDVEGKYDGVISKWGSSVRVIMSSDGSPDLAILAADLTVGMNSSLLYEAVALGRPALSLTGHDILASKSTAI